MKQKTVIVLFSGGLDSTYLVWKNLKEGNTVIPVYFEIENNENKAILEKNRINLLYNEFYREFEKIKRPYFPLSVSVSSGMNNLSFKQVPIWLLGLLYFQHYDANEIHIGYTGNDDVLGIIQDINKIYKSYQIINFEKLIPIKFPLSKIHKNNFIKELPKKYFDLVVSCENPTIHNKKSKFITYTPCGECAACQRIINTDYFGQGLTKSYEKIKEKQIIEAYNSLMRKNSSITKELSITKEEKTKLPEKTLSKM